MMNGKLEMPSVDFLLRIFRQIVIPMSKEAIDVTLAIHPRALTYHGTLKESTQWEGSSIKANCYLHSDLVHLSESC